MNEPQSDPSPRVRAGQSIQYDVANLAEQAVDRQLRTHPEMREDFVGPRYLKAIQDTTYPLTALAQALLIEEPVLFVSYVIWAGIVLGNLGLPDRYLAGSLTAIRKTLVASLDDRLSEAAAEYIDLSLSALTDTPAQASAAPQEGAPFENVALGYREALLAGDRAAAAGIVRDAVAAGAILQDIYEHVFKTTQHEVGRLWQSNRLSVAMEHYSTGATEAIMAQLSVTEPSAAAGAPRFLGACVEGEEHDMAIRMVCDVLRAQGWDTFFLGASTPEYALVQAVEEFRPNALGLSATWLFNVDSVRCAVARVHRTHPDVKIVVGGAPFDRIAGLADKVGADARGTSLLELPTQLDRLISVSP